MLVGQVGETARGCIGHDERVSDAAKVPPRLWEEWAGITRFLESTRLAFARETTLWKGLELDAPPEEVRISVSVGTGSSAWP